MKLLVAQPIAEPAPPTLGASSRFRLRHAMSNPRGHGLTEPESRVRPLCGLCGFTNHPRCHQNIIISARRIDDDTKNGARTAPPPSDAVPTCQPFAFASTRRRDKTQPPSARVSERRFRNAFPARREQPFVRAGPGLRSETPRVPQGAKRWGRSKERARCPFSCTKMRKWGHRNGK